MSGWITAWSSPTAVVGTPMSTASPGATTVIRSPRSGASSRITAATSPIVWIGASVRRRWSAE